MKVRDVMTAAVAACRREDSLRGLTQIMIDRHCGIVPVLDPAGLVAGVVTDRDVAIAATLRPAGAGSLTASDVMSYPVHACLPADTVETALGMMRRFRVRRLPVLDSDGHLQGILSLDDVVIAAHDRGEPPVAEVVETLAALCHRAPVAG